MFSDHPPLQQQPVDEKLRRPVGQCAVQVLAPDRIRARDPTPNVTIVREHRLGPLDEVKGLASSTKQLATAGVPVETQPSQRHLGVAGETGIGRAPTPPGIEDPWQPPRELQCSRNRLRGLGDGGDPVAPAQQL